MQIGIVAAYADRYCGCICRSVCNRSQHCNFIETHTESSLIMVYVNRNTLEKLLTNYNSVALVRTRTIPTERPPPVGEVSANFCG